MLLLLSSKFNMGTLNIVIKINEISLEDAQNVVNALRLEYETQSTIVLSQFNENLENIPLETLRAQQGGSNE